MSHVKIRSDGSSQETNMMGTFLSNQSAVLKSHGPVVRLPGSKDRVRDGQGAVEE